MLEAEESGAILFADICGSTPLYEDTGNVFALGVISECIDVMGSLTEEHGGTIVRSKGDDILCTFTSAENAIKAALGMIARQADSEAQIHVGVNYGEFIRARGDIFGDAVNVAARMLSLAKPGEIVTTESVSEQLPPAYESKLRLLDRLSIKGKSKPLNVYTVVPEGDEDVTRFLTEFGGQDPRAESLDRLQALKPRLELVIGGQSFQCSEGDPVFRMGRSGDCDLIIDEPCVSREHAQVEIRRGKVVIVDRSSTGTWVRAAKSEPILLRREALQLVGDGVLSLGRKLDDSSPNLIRFQQSTGS